jgi:hypothetical protein
VTRRAWNGNQRRPRIERNAVVQQGLGSARALPARCDASRRNASGAKSGEGSAPSPVREGTRALQKLKMARYGDFFGDTDGEVLGGAVTGTPDAPAAGVAAASPGFALNSSTSKIRVAFGPMSPPAPLGP